MMKDPTTRVVVAGSMLVWLPNLFYLLSSTTSTTTSITLIMFIMALYILFPVFLHYAYKTEMGDWPVMIVARIFNFTQMFTQAFLHSFEH